MRSRNIETESLARQIETKDFSEFKYIFGMDEDNIFDLNGISPEDCKAEIKMLGEYHEMGEKKDPLVIRDPYYDSGDEGFEVCYNQCVQCLNNFLDQVEPDTKKK